MSEPWWKHEPRDWWKQIRRDDLTSHQAVDVHAWGDHACLAPYASSGDKTGITYVAQGLIWLNARLKTYPDELARAAVLKFAAASWENFCALRSADELGATPAQLVLLAVEGSK